MDDERRRSVWSASGGATTHYNAVLQITADGDSARVQWVSDFLPEAVAAILSSMQDQGAAMKRAFEKV